ncbi:MAG: LysE family transporter [Alphaproteobacteria bacterium]
MPASDLLIPFLIASATFACVSGPAMLYALVQTMVSGRRAGWYVAVGFHPADVGHIATAAFGVTILLQMIPTLLVIIKAVGATYLIWLGVRYLTGQAPFAGPSGPAWAPKLRAL